MWACRNQKEIEQLGSGGVGHGKGKKGTMHILHTLSSSTLWQLATTVLKRSDSGQVKGVEVPGGLQLHGFTD